MAFWGVYLKPNQPYTLHHDDRNVPNRLRITQATLGDATRNSPARSIVRCSVGDKPAIAICSLSVKELTCCQLELEFEESHDVVFSVMGPRGVYLAGYLVAPPPAACQHSLDHDLHKDDIDFNVADPVKESIDAQNTDIEHSDKNDKCGKLLLKCSRNKNIMTLDRKTGIDDNEGSDNEGQEKTIAVKSHSAFGRLLEQNRQATEKMKQNRRRKRKQNSCEATSSDYVDDIRSSGVRGGRNHENLERKKKSDGSKDCIRKKKKKSKFVSMKKFGL